MSDPPVHFDKTTALEVVSGVTPDDTTVADPSSASEPSILRDLAPRAVAAPGAGSRQLAANYRAILAARAIY